MPRLLCCCTGTNALQWALSNHWFQQHSIDSMSKKSDIQEQKRMGLQTDQILLGMSFLKHIEFTQRGDTLILRQPGSL